MGVFENYDFSRFWDDSDYSIKHYVMETPKDELIQEVEETLGYKLPASYIELMKMHNGGIIKSMNFIMKETAIWSPEHISIAAMIGIGKNKTYSLCGILGTRYMIDQCGYPDIGICICDTPAAGHEVIMLDYRICGQNGEPQVIYVDKEAGNKIIYIAKNFETFIKSLVVRENDEEDDEDEVDDNVWID